MLAAIVVLLMLSGTQTQAEPKLVDVCDISETTQSTVYDTRQSDT